MSQTELLSAVQALVAADSVDSLRDVLARSPVLHNSETDRQLTRVIQAGLQRDAIAAVSSLFVVRDFMLRLRRGQTLEAASSAVGGAPLYRADPIGQLIRDPQPSLRQVDLCRRALDLVRGETEPALWAYLHFLLADRLMLDRTPPRIQAAVGAFQVAGDVWEACGQFEQAAQARYELARLLIDFSSGDDRTVALQRAVKVLESTLAVWTRDAHPQEWGNVQAAVGLAIENSPGGLDADSLERAIGHYEAALYVPIDPSFSPAFELARRQYHLAILYAQRYRDDRVTNVERAIELLQAALEVRTRDRHPEEWADTKDGLGNALQQRLRGDPAQNLEQAILAYQNALQVWTRQRNPARWATIQRNLAEAYRHRVLGQPEENQETAIACFSEALAVYTRREHPSQWASVHNSLANLYCNRRRDGRASNIESGIYHYNQALEVYTRDAYPRQWAQTMNNLANAYCERVDGDHLENLHAAIALYQQSLEVRTRQSYPLEWADTYNNVGTAYAGLQQVEQAIEHFQKALEVRTVDALPDKALQTARNLGKLHFDRGKWREAISAYWLALSASDRLYHQAVTEAGKRAEIGRVGEVTHPIAYALAQAGDLKEAVLALERGRARLLAEALSRDRAMLDGICDQDRKKYEDAVRRIRALESELRAAELDAQGATDKPNTRARSFVELAEELASARQELDRVVQSIRQIAGFENFLALPDWGEVARAVLPDMSLVYLVVTPAGGLALAVHKTDAISVESIQLDDLTDETLSQWVSKWLEVYSHYVKARIAYGQAVREIERTLPPVSEQEKKARLQPLKEAAAISKKAWFAVVEETTCQMWNALVGPLVGALQKWGYQQATLIPTGLLAFLPLHAAWRLDKDGARQYALDDIAFAFAPSARALAYAQRVATTVVGVSLLGVENPDGSLAYAAQEMEAVTRHFADSWVVSGERATRNTVLQALPKHDVYHLACHGNSNWDDPLKSALWMLEHVPLSLRDLLALESKPQARLAFLSACETGLPGIELPDEVVGLAAGFQQAGAAGVVSTLWSVEDKSTALLAGRFYENWKGSQEKPGMLPLPALAAAQQWLRDEAEGGKWAHPYYWAAFTLMGT